MILILDNIRSAENVGSMFRTADAFGVTKIYLCGITPAPIDRFGRPVGKVVKAALGAEKSVAWESAKDTVALITKLKSEGTRIIALEQHPSSVPPSATKDSEVALVVGNEVEGVGPEALALADQVVEIPMAGAKESLNVAVATGIALFALKGT